MSRTPIVGLVCALLLARPAVGQAVVSFELGSLRTVDGGFLQAGFRAATAEPDRVGVEGAAAILPELSRNGSLAVLTDVGLAFPTGGSAVLVIPHVGLSVIGIGGALPGVSVGIGTVVRIRGRVGVRADYTYRRFFAGEAWLPVSSFTAGAALLRSAPVPRGTGR